EAAHLVLHGKREVFLEGIEDPDQRMQEEEANAFAAHFLVPDGDLDEFELGVWKMDPGIEPTAVSERAVRRFAKRIGVAPGIVVGRLQHEKMIPFSHLNGLKRSFEWTDRVEMS
ncbi:MAG TPA: ImmA/IrrE family metallo-endopeptidase, partial [Rhodothermales bacterium]